MSLNRVIALAGEFQSTPPAEARGDFTTGCGCISAWTRLFQSTPPAEARGDAPCL